MHLIKKILWFLLACILNVLFSVKRKHWVFGSDTGNMYREGSKYLIEYMIKYHPDYNCTFITCNPDVVKDLKDKGIPVAHNYSLKGIYRIVTSDSIFTTQVLNDIKFMLKKDGRSLYYLVHGQPFKNAMNMLPQSYRGKYLKRKGHLDRISKLLSKSLYHHDDIDFVSATSDFTAKLMRKEFSSKVDVKILGMPRNDALFDDERMKNEKWNNSFTGKFVVTYMPTHRKYGKGELSQSPFWYREDVQQWMRENNVILLVKQHPNMVKKITAIEETDVIKNISKAGYDPQVVIYHSDVLITDFSSVWMDYLLLRRPLIFYFYDNFEEDDAGCYYNLRDEFPNNWCDSEDGLYQKIKMAYENKSCLTPSDNEVHKFHKYVDNKSCERYYKEIAKMKYGEE